MYSKHLYIYIKHFWPNNLPKNMENLSIPCIIIIKQSCKTGVQAGDCVVHISNLQADCTFFAYFTSKLNHIFFNIV